MWKYKIEKEGHLATTNLPIYEIRALPSLTLDEALEEISTLRVGMTRDKVLSLFDYCGGFYSGHQMVFSYRRNPLIKIKVDFEPFRSDQEKDTFLDARDRVIELSQPFLNKKSIFGGI